MPDRILIIDDEPQITRVLARGTDGAGLTMCARQTIPRKACRSFKDWPPDLVITDLMMPGHERRRGHARHSTHIARRQCSFFRSASTSAPRWKRSMQAQMTT